MIDCMWLCSSGWVENTCDDSHDHDHKKKVSLIKEDSHQHKHYVVAKGRPIDKCMFNYLEKNYYEEFLAIREQEI
jgi:hypothetical protein